MQYLYIIKCQEFHKIGIANDVDTRLSQLSTGNPYPLDVVSIYGFPNAETVERALHQRYSDVRVRGEWFGLDDHDISDIDLVCKMLGGELIETVSEVTEDKLDEAEESNVYIPCIEDVEKVMNDPNYRLEYRSSNNGVYGFLWRSRYGGRDGALYIGRMNPIFEDVKKIVEAK